MIEAYTGTEVRAAERPLLDQGAGDVLMQRAAHGLANAVVRELRSRNRRLYGASVVVLAGKGNNGGDGLYAAALLAARGMRTTAVLTSGGAHHDALAAFQRAGGRAEELTQADCRKQARKAVDADVVIDAILGTGARGGLHGLAADLVRAISGLQEAGRALVVACDLPSGVDADTGFCTEPVLPAHVTVTFGAAKAGLLADPGAGAAGRMEVVPIGLEPHLPVPRLKRLERQDLAALLPQPARQAHKYSRGVLGVVAGSSQYPGAAVLTCRAALAAGVGMIRYLGPPDVARLVQQWCPEVVCGSGSVAETHVQAWVVGPGTGPGHDDQLERARDAVASGLPVVADAGALPVLPDGLAPHVVLTPHAGELAALLTRLGHETKRDAVERSTLEAVTRAARSTGATVLLKGATTLVAIPDGEVFSQAEGTPWLATAGSGDILAGIIGALLAQGGADALTSRTAGPAHARQWSATAAAGASLHGLAGTYASEIAGSGPITAGSIADSLPHIWGNVSMLSNL